MSKPSFAAPPWRILFFGTGEIGLPTLQYLAADPRVELLGVVTGPNRPSGRGLQLLPGPVAQFAMQHAFPLWQPQKLGEPGIREAWQELSPDLLVVMAYGKILPSWVLRLPRVAPWNLHASLLPRHRGASPINAAILAGDPLTGITVMHMEEGLDTGDMLSRESIEISETDTAGTLHDRLATLGPIALEKTLDQLAAGTLTGVAQNDEDATYAGKISKQDGMIDWRLTANEIYRRIRAFTPWPGAQTILQTGNTGLPFKIGSAAPGGRDFEAAPGSLLCENNSRLYVSTGLGTIELLAVQIPGKKMLPTADFLRGFSLPADAEFQISSDTG
jgi:methionyl-tRNA formyltransferase